MHQIGPCPILRVEFDYQALTDEATSSLFGSLLHPYWRESEAQLTEKQAVLLMHDIYKTLGNEMFYGPEEDPVDQQEQPQQ